MLTSISPIDGRYRKTSEPLANFFSEMALIKYRIMVEGEYLIALSEQTGIKIKKISQSEKLLIRGLYEITPDQAQIVNDIETKGYKNIKATDHDVKAVEYFIKDRLSKTGLKDSLEWVHFALTSEDTNNVAYALMLSDALAKIIIPKLEEIITAMNSLAEQNKNVAMLARTHGQSASPTTFGKEFKVFSGRLFRQFSQLKKHHILAKLNGATGNFNAHVAAYPKVDWLKFSQKFIESFNNKTRTVELKANLHTTQIEPHDSYVEIFDTVKHINNILIDFNQDMWRYISDGWIVQKPVEGAIGSSTMPHKINPIKFENSEGNLGLANSLFEFFSRKLPVSRLQRDLSDSTVQRNFGTAFAHSLIAYDYLLKGLAGISIDQSKVKQELENHPEIIAEAIQTVLRREGVAMPYEKLKALTRGRQVTMEDFEKFIDSLEINDQIKKELKQFTPTNYTGLAEKLSSI